jgi:pimeloyl-ACP methyl ester carboxylesterase
MPVLMLAALLLLLGFQSAETDYPHPVRAFETTLEGQAASMAFMDVPAVKPNGETVLLLHGKNFNGFYWKGVIRALTDAGFRVVAPDQVGWGKSSKPKMHYSFHQLASTTKKLLDSLGVAQVHVVGHSMGGMLAVRFALMHPDAVTKLVLENPIGLEDYRAFVPYRSTDDLEKEELAATYESIKAYQKTYYPEWKPEYEPYVAAQAEALGKPDYPKVAFVNALTTQMIYEQPVVHEFKNLAVPTLLVIGQEDRTVVGKNRLPKEAQGKHGQYPELGRKAKEAIRNSRLVELAGVGHIPHVQAPEEFRKALLEFLQSK